MLQGPATRPKEIQRVRIVRGGPNPISQEPGDMAIPTLHHLDTTTRVGRRQLSQILGVETPRQLRRAHQVAEHHRQLPPLGHQSRDLFAHLQLRTPAQQHRRLARRGRQSPSAASCGGRAGRQASPGRPRLPRTAPHDRSRWPRTRPCSAPAPNPAAKLRCPRRPSCDDDRVAIPTRATDRRPSIVPSRL
jgi:hypothetical protein